MKKNAFVLLWAEISAEEWERKYYAGDVPDVSPYGYHYLRDFGYKVVFSRKKDVESRIAFIVRKIISKFFGADLIHAWRHFADLCCADVILTHTDRESFAILILKALFPGRIRGRTICQIIWTADRLKRSEGIKAKLAGLLLGKADLVTTLSSINAQWIKAVNRLANVEMVHFGISSDSFTRRHARSQNNGDTLNILAIGNDEHRDWVTFASALKDFNDVSVRILSKTFRRTVQSFPDAWSVESASSLRQVKEAYKWADIVVVPLKRNMHASGITCVLEATFLGVPVIAADAGGLTDYFGADEVLYYSVGDHQSLRRRLVEMANDSNTRLRYCRAAQHRATSKDLTSKNYIRQQIALLNATAVQK